MNYKEQRPWGEFENLLDSTLCKVKQIIIKPGQAPSYQYHFKRSEVWILTQGNGELKLDENITKVKKGDVLATISDPYGKVEHKVKAPHAGYIINVNDAPIIYQGDALFHVSIE